MRLKDVLRLYTCNSTLSEPFSLSSATNTDFSKEQQLSALELHPYGHSFSIHDNHGSDTTPGEAASYRRPDRDQIEYMYPHRLR